MTDIAIKKIFLKKQCGYDNIEKTIFVGVDNVKKISNGFIIRIVTIGLMLLALLIACITSNQSRRAFCIPQTFQGEYSLDGGNTWSEFSDNTKISAKNQYVILRGNFGIPFQEGTPVNFYLDHITMEIFVDKEQYFYDSAVQLGVKSYTCGKKWVCFVTPEMSENDIMEIHLRNPHKFGNINAFDELLGSVYVGSGDVFESFMLKTGKPGRITGAAIIVAAAMLLAAAMFFMLMHIDGGRTVGNLGIFALFFGVYILFDTVDLSLWSNSYAFNTYTLQISIMLAATCASVCIAESLKSKAAEIAHLAAVFSMIVNSVFAVLSIFGVIVIYDAMFFWLLAHIAVYGILLVCCIYECLHKTTKGYLEIILDFAVIIAAFADIVCFFAKSSHNGIVSKTVFVVLFLIQIARILRVIPMNFNAAREAEQLKSELAESRISITLSQIQPHFLYNALNTIYGLCEKDPSSAKKAVSDFSDYLRGNMDSLTRKVPVPFETEIKHLKAYLSLEQTRFKNKLNVVWDIQTDSFMIPSLTVQPLVENAVKHGICKKEDGGTLKISTRECDDCFEVEIYDNGIGFDINKEKNDGNSHLGIENVRNRLSKMSNATLEISSEKGKGTTALIKIPKT